MTGGLSKNASLPVGCSKAGWLDRRSQTSKTLTSMEGQLRVLCLQLLASKFVVMVWICNVLHKLKFGLLCARLVTLIKRQAKKVKEHTGNYYPQLLPIIASWDTMT